MHWTIAAPFFKADQLPTLRWIDDFVPGKHSFNKILRPDGSGLNWHQRSSRNTQLDEWMGYWQQSQEAWQTTQGGVVTVFPQLALTTALRKNFAFKKRPLIAWCFNLGACYPGLKQRVSSTILKHVDRFVVHSRRECETVSQWLGLPQERFEFVPFQHAGIPIVESEEVKNPFILAMGSANRDYHTFLQAVEKLGIRTIVVAAPHAIQGLEIPACVELRSGLTHLECLSLAQQARISVVPLIESDTAAGQVTIVEAMCMQRPIVATRCTGSEDYIQHGETGLLVKPGSVVELVNAIEHLWSSPVLRHDLGQAAGRFTEIFCSDQAAGKALGAILDQF
jgi:hypothetical protein